MSSHLCKAPNGFPWENRPYTEGHVSRPLACSHLAHTAEGNKTQQTSWAGFWSASCMTRDLSHCLEGKICRAGGVCCGLSAVWAVGRATGQGRGWQRSLSNFLLWPIHALKKDQRTLSIEVSQKNAEGRRQTAQPRYWFFSFSNPHNQTAEQATQLLPSQKLAWLESVSWVYYCIVPSTNTYHESNIYLELFWTKSLFKEV